MEVQWPPLPLLTLIIFLILFVLMRKGATGGHPTKLPPGPRGLPFIGSIHHLRTSLPHRTLRNLGQEHGPLMHLKLGQVSTVVVSSPEMAREVLKTHDLVFANRSELLASKIIAYGGTDVVFAPYGEYWRQIRKICILELLSAKRVQSFRRVREEEVCKLIDSIRDAAGAQPVNLTQKLYALSGSIVSRAAFGKKCSHHERFATTMRQARNVATGFSFADLFPSLEFVSVISGMKRKVEMFHRRIDGILEEIVQEHKEKRARKMTTSDQDGEEVEDLLDVLLRIQEARELDFPLTANNVKAVILDMFSAGTDTSASSNVWTMAELMKNPKVMQKAQAEVREVIRRKGKVPIDESAVDDMKYLRMVIKESLRLHPPVPLLVPRECRKRCEVAGYEIPAKARVLVNAWAIGRDPQQWDKAEEFDPARFDGSGIDFRGGSMEFIPFGAGRRVCPGVLFGVAGIELALAQLLYHFDWEIPGGVRPEEFDMTEAAGMSVAKKLDLCLLAKPYVPSAEETR